MGTSKCHECDAPSETLTPDGLVCRHHAIAYYQGLLQCASGLRALAAHLEPDPPEPRLMLSVVERMHRQWVQQNYPEDAPVRREHQSRGSVLRKFERRVLIDALAQSNWRQDRAAVQLGLTKRGIAYKIKSHQITPPPPVRWGALTRQIPGDS